MKILLLGEYSNVHATLAEGLRILGHKVIVASNGDFWKNYPRDISLVRRTGKIGGIELMLKTCSLLPRFRGYDVVQLINPMFIELRAERLFAIYNYLRKHNRQMFLGGFGMDWYWVNGCTYKKPLRYSDFNIGQNIRTNADAEKERREWLGTNKGRLNQYIANDSDGIITGLYEYWACYYPEFPAKTVFIPFPIKTESTQQNLTNPANGRPIKIFIGINKARNKYKGTDIMLQAATDVMHKYPNKMELIKVESVPFAEYQKLMEGCDVILDQLYSYTPSMNSLLAMSKGIICIGGGEEENYSILHENSLRPIINVHPNYSSVYHELEQIITHPERIPVLKRQSIEYVEKHHNYIKVAKQYEELYKKKAGME